MKVIVAGAGEVGFNICEKLSREKADVVLIDNNTQRLSQVMDSLDVKAILGSASKPSVLLEAGLRESDLLVAVTASDETNILATKLCQILAPKVQRVARVRDSSYYHGLDEEIVRTSLGLNYIIDPTRLTVETILDFLEIPGAGDVIDISGRLKLIGLRLQRHHHLVGKTLAEGLPRDGKNHLLVAAIYRNHNLLIPEGKTVLKARDLLYLASTPENLPEVISFFELSDRPVREIFILGGGEVGLALARELEKKELTVKLIEQNQERCDFLSQELARTIVLKGDATDQSLLEEEGVADCDVFVAVGTDDEKNMISCLLARRLGAFHTIIRINRGSYVPLVSAIGLEALVSARVAAVSAILKYIRKGRVISVNTLKNEDAEIIEIEVPEQSRLVGLTLALAKFPPGAIVTALIRGEEVIIPRGDTVIEKGDILAVVTRSESVRLLEKTLA